MKQSIVSQNELDTLSVFKYLLLMGVLGIHASFINDYPTGTLPLAGAVVIECLEKYILQLTVPAFFVISGYLFFRDGIPTHEVYKRKLRSRVRTLVVPYFLWCTIALITVLIKKSLFLNDFFPQYAVWNPDLVNVISGYFSFQDNQPYDFVLWFVRNLMFIVALTPVIGFIFRHLGAFSLILFILISYMPIPWGMGVSLVFFCYGACVALFFGSIIGFLEKYGAYFSISWLCFVVIDYLRMPFLADYTYFFVLCCGAFALLWAFNHQYRLVSNIPRSIYSTAFFVYAFHGLFISVLRKAVTALIPPSNSLIEIIDFIIIAFAALVICTTIAIFCRKVWPKGYDVLCGSR